MNATLSNERHEALVNALVDAVSWQTQAETNGYAAGDPAVDMDTQDVANARAALMAALNAGAVKAEPVAYINAYGGVLMTPNGEEWFKGIRANLAPVGTAAAPLFATVSNTEQVVAMQEALRFITNTDNSHKSVRLLRAALSEPQS